MQDLSALNGKNIQFFFSDIDDTMTTDGMLEADAYEALWKLQEAGIEVIPITGRPAGWCEMIARMWPVKAVIGENGALSFSYDRENKKMKRIYFQSDSEMKQNQDNIMKIAEEVLQQFPGTALASDQFCRLLDVAVDFCEDVDDLGKETANQIAKHFQEKNAVAKVSSIHVNAWFGDHDKLKMCKHYLKEEYNLKLDEIQDQLVFSGDSPNDEPLFGAFENSVGVANVNEFKDQLKSPPKFICKQYSGKGFVELANQILKQKAK